MLLTADEDVAPVSHGMPCARIPKQYHGNIRSNRRHIRSWHPGSTSILDMASVQSMTVPGTVFEKSLRLDIQL